MLFPDLTGLAFETLVFIFFLRRGKIAAAVENVFRAGGKDFFLAAKRDFHAGRGRGGRILVKY